MEHLIPWLTLKSAPGLGNLRCRRLLDHFGSPEAILDATPARLARVEGVTSRLANVIARHRTPDQVHAELERVADSPYRIITLHDPHYPALLLEIPDPPPILYVYGQLDRDNNAIAVVGSRKASTYGLTTTHRLCKGMAALGVTVVSGMARGIDTAAHKGALAGHGRTVAVLGSGLACIYPPENRKLFHEIAANGAVITEFRLDAQPEGRRFPMRNRLISGLSLGTVVVEAAQRSGSLITARLAAEQGREVFAVPGNIHVATTQGTHHLIQQGAKLVRGVADILEEIGPRYDHPLENGPEDSRRSPSPSVPSDLSAPEIKVFGVLGGYGLHIDQLSVQLDLDMAALTGALMQLVLRGMVRQEPGNQFVRHEDYMNIEI